MEEEASVPLSTSDPEFLLREARQGSLSALGALFERLRPRLAQVSEYEMDADLRPKAGASDLVQQSFLEAYRDFDTFEGESPEQLEKWVKAILISNIGDFRRSFRGTAKRRVDNEVRLDGLDSTNRWNDVLAGGEESPSQRLRGREQDEQLDRAIAALPEQYRKAILLRHRDHLSFAEIGKQMNRTEEAARKCWSRAVQKLQLELDQDHSDRG